MNTSLTVQDFRAFVAFLARQGNSAVRFLEPVLFGLGCALILKLLRSLFRIDYDGPTMAITLVASIVTVLLYFLYRSRRLWPVPGGLVLGEKQITLCPEGLRQSSVLHESLFRWPLVRSVAETPRHIFILLDRHAGVIIPRSSFLTLQDCDAFLAEVRALSGRSN